MKTMNNAILVRRSFQTESTEKITLGPRRARGRPSLGPIPQPRTMHVGRLPLSEKKFKDLETLCRKGTIPPEHQNEYLSFPHDLNARDCLPQTDDDESDN